MPFTVNDVGNKMVDGKEVKLTIEEKQAICDEWNANEAYQNDPVREDERAVSDIEGSKIKKVFLKIAFDFENRLRLMEGKTPYSIDEYKSYLISMYKAL